MNPWKWSDGPPPLPFGAWSSPSSAMRTLWKSRCLPELYLLGISHGLLSENWQLNFLVKCLPSWPDSKLRQGLFLVIDIE